MVGVNVSVSKKDGFPTLKFSKWVNLETVPQAAVHPRWETSKTNLKKCAKLMEVFLRTEGEHWNKVNKMLDFVYFLIFYRAHTT